MSRRAILAGAIAALALFTAADHGLRKMQATECQLGDVMPCPDKLWWFVPAAETDGELEALFGVHPLERRLVGYGCDGYDTPIFRNEEDEFPLCDRIEGI